MPPEKVKESKPACQISDADKVDEDPGGQGVEDRQAKAKGQRERDENLERRAKGHRCDCDASQ